MSDSRHALDPSDDVLVGRARDGDAAAMEMLVRRNHGVVYRFLVSFLRDEDDASDVAQETFVKVLSRLDGFRGESSFRTWVLAIARNEGLRLVRSRGRRKEDAPDGMDGFADPSGPVDEQVLREDEVERVRVVLNRLPEKQRLSVSLRLFDEMSFREIGEVIGSSEGAARVNYHFGIGRLREWLNEG